MVNALGAWLRRVSRSPQERAVERCLAASHTGEKLPPIRHFAVLTNARPAALTRCLESYLGNVAAHDRTLACLVVDDSADRETVRRNWSAIDGAVKKWGRPVSHVTRAKRSLLIETISHEAGVDPELVRFAMDPQWQAPIRFGASRNVATLLAGQRMIVSDDDSSYCGTSLDGGTSMSVEVGINRETLRIVPGSGQQTSECSDHGDFVGIHERLLGRSVASVLSQFEKVSWNGGSEPFVRDIETNSARVGTTVTGLVGHAGSSSTDYLFQLDGTARSAWVQSREVYERALSSGTVLRAVRHYAFDEMRFIPSVCVGYDASHIMPPFIPIGRGEDRVHAECIGVCFPKLLIGTLPMLIKHEPVEARSHVPGSGLKDYPLHDVVVHCVRLAAFDATGLPPDLSLRRLGRSLSSIAGMRSDEFLHEMRRERIRQIEFVAADYEAKLDELEGPAYWREGLIQQLAAAEEAIAWARHYPSDVGICDSPADAFLHAQKLVGRFGELLEAWPEIWHAGSQHALDVDRG